MPDSISGRRLTELTQLKRLEDAKLGGFDCVRVQGTFLIEVGPAEQERRRKDVRKVTGKEGSSPVRGPETLWIDRSSFLLRRIDVQTQFDDFRTESNTTYEPFVDVAVADSQLKFDAPDK